MNRPPELVGHRVAKKDMRYLILKTRSFTRRLRSKVEAPLGILLTGKNYTWGVNVLCVAFKTATKKHYVHQR